MNRLSSATVVSLGSIVALSVAAGTQAQPVSAPQYLFIHEEFPKPAMIKEYESVSREFVVMVAAKKAKLPHFSASAFASPDLTYTFVTPVPNPGGGDGMYSELIALAYADPAVMDLVERTNAIAPELKDMVVQLLPELSYVPDRPRLQPGTACFYHYDMYYLTPGRQAEAEAVAADYVKALKAKGDTTGYNLYKAVTGPDTPLYIGVVPANDAADYESSRAKRAALLGAELASLQARAKALTRRFEARQMVARPDLSVPK